MGYDDGAWEVRAHGWRSVAALHDVVDRGAAQALRRVGLSVVEYTLLDVLARQQGKNHLRMSQVARATVLSESAATRLVDRLNARGLLTRYVCEDDRRGVYTELTPAGHDLLDQSRPVYLDAVEAALSAARDTPELQPVVDALRPMLEETSRTS